LAGGNVHQLEFEGEFQARLVENGYNRLPVFVVEGSIRNTFNESDQIKKIQLKAFAFDADQQLIANHFTYAGTVLPDEQLESLSPHAHQSTASFLRIWDSGLHCFKERQK
jgi:hypothetical protein